MGTGGAGKGDRSRFPPLIYISMECRDHYLSPTWGNRPIKSVFLALILKFLGIGEHAFVVGHVGRFFAPKNHEFLIDVFYQLQKRLQSAFLLLIGAGPLEETIKEKINSLGLDTKVLILSHRTDIPHLLKTMDVFVFPSKYEGFPVTLVEAQVAGLRCIVSDKISHESFLCDTVIPLSIDESPNMWCNTILDETIKGVSYGNLGDYDMNKEIKRLENFYSGGSDDGIESEKHKA